MNIPIAHKYTKFADLPGESEVDKIQRFINSSISGTITVQEKLNGISCRFINRRLYTRTGKEWQRFHFPAEFWDELDNRPLHTGQCLLGELVSDSLSFQDLGRAVGVNRNTAGDTTSVRLVAYDFYDYMLPCGSQPYEVRQDTLKFVVPRNGYKNKLLSSFRTADPQMVIKAYGNLIARNKEGLIMIADPYYINDPSIKTSADIVKWKRLKEIEGRCVDVFEGKGKRKGMLGSALLLLPNGKYVLAGGGTGVSDVVLTNLWNNPPFDKQITITYEDESTTGVPLRPQIKSVRDYE
jgi:DNA ligase-1